MILVQSSISSSAIGVSSHASIKASGISELPSATLVLHNVLVQTNHILLGASVLSIATNIGYIGVYNVITTDINYTEYFNYTPRNKHNCASMNINNTLPMNINNTTEVIKCQK